MRITITSINFSYENGFEQDYTGVNLNYMTSGFKFNPNESVSITREEYENNRNNKDGLKALIAEKIISDGSTFIDEVEAYKESLQAE